eukprot:UN03642
MGSKYFVGKCTVTTCTYSLVGIEVHQDPRKIHAKKNPFVSEGFKNMVHF